MKWRLKCICLLLISTFCLSASSASAAEKNKTLVQLDATRSAVESAAGKIEANKEAAADLERARAALKNADESYKAGRSMFGFGDISPETEKEIKLSIDMADLATATALSRLEYVRASAELETIEKQFTSVNAKIKLFEDRKAELERLRLEVAACQKAGKELETMKAEKAALTSQVEQLGAERSMAEKLKVEKLEIIRKMDELIAENARLSALLEKQQNAVPASDDIKKDATKK